MSLSERIQIFVLVSCLLWGAGVGAHPYAASGFDAVTEGNALFVQFRVDAVSTVELLGRTLGGKVEKAEIDGYGGKVAAYVAEHFLVGNDGAACTGGPQGAAHFDARTDKVFLAVVYRCGRPLGVLTLATTLFDEDQGTPHQILGVFRHQRAQENYLLTRGSSQAIIDTAHLAQVAPAEAARPGQVRLVTPPPGAFDGERPAPRLATAPIGRGFTAFIWQGVLHILGGLDHVLFVIALVSVVTSWRQLAQVITSFTLAHSMTLALGALDLVHIPSRVVEPLIAASIIYVAVENAVRQQPQARVLITFAFGLMHGFGFSSVLRDLGLQSGNLVPSLLGFNLGVEAGQLLIVAPLAPGVWWLQRHFAAYRRVRLALNVTVALVATWWFVQRLRGG